MDIRLARPEADALALPLPSAAVADWMLTNTRELGYAHRDRAALREVLVRTAPETSPPLA